MSGGGDISYYEIIILALFLMAQWYSARFCIALNFPTIPVEIGVGLLFGPHGLDLIPAFSHDYSPLSLLGFIGVGIVIFESGMHLHIEKVCNWDIGHHVVIVAVIGTILPICLGLGVFAALGFDAYPNGLAAGFSLAPTSVGISLTLLSRAKQLNTRCGQIVMTAAFLDDIFSIICLVVMTNLAEGELNVVLHIIIPLIGAIGFVVIGGALSVMMMPGIMPYLLDTSSPLMQFLDVESRALNMKDELHLGYMVLAYLLFSYIGSIIGSALLGCFVAGMLFSSIPRSHLIWEKQFKRLTRWLLRLFFSCTVAFSINIADLFTTEAFLMGLLMAAGPCLLSKVIAGVFVGDERWVVGVAMMARGEFAYLVAAEANNLELLNDLQYAVIVWALLWATMIAPLAFNQTLKSFIKQQYELVGVTRSDQIGGDKFSGASSFIIRYAGIYQVDMVKEVCESLHALGLDIRKCVVENQGEYGVGTIEVYPKQVTEIVHKYGNLAFTDKDASNRYKMVTDITDDKLQEIAQYLNETISDPHSQIFFEPYEEDKMIEIEVYGEGYKSILSDIQSYLTDVCKLMVIKLVVDKEFEETSGEMINYSVFYCHKKAVVMQHQCADETASTRVSDEMCSDIGHHSHHQHSKLGQVINRFSGHTAKHRIALKNKGVNLKDKSTIRLLRAHDPTATVAQPLSRTDCIRILRQLRALFEAKGTPSCDAAVRLMHEDAVVFAHNEIEQEDLNLKDLLKKSSAVTRTAARTDASTDIELTHIHPSHSTV